MKKILILSILLCPFFCLAQDKDKRGVILTNNSSRESGKTYAVVIGISKYKEVAALKYADRDAIIFADYLLRKDGAGLDSGNVKLFVNDQATINNVGNALSDIIIGNLKKGDKIIFFFAGHGDYDATILKDQALLLLYGAPKKNYFQNIFSGDFISTNDLNSRFVEPLAAKGCEVILILDACHATGLNKSLSGGAEGGKITTMALQNMTSPVKLYSCQANEYSLESDEWGGGRGLFSYVLMEGLYGMADADNNKTVSLRELQRWLEDNVPKMAAPNRQNPIVKIEDATEPISKVNDAFVASYQSNKNKKLPFIAKTDTKGSYDFSTDLKDSIQKRLYVACEKFIEEMKLDSAYTKFLLFANLDSTSNASLQLRRNLSAALQSRAAVILNPMVEDVRRFNSRPEVVMQAGNDLEKAITLLGENHFLYNNLKARVLFLKVISSKKLKSTKKEMIGYLYQSMQLEPNAPYAYFYLGKYYNLETKYYPYDTAGVYHNFDSSLKYFQEYLSLVPKLSAAYNAVSTVYAKINRDDLSIKYKKQAIEIEPGNPEYYDGIAGIYLEQRNKQQTLAYDLKALELIARDPEKYKDIAVKTNLRLGVLYQEEENYDSSIYYFKRVLAIDPKLSFAIQDIAYSYTQIKKYDTALVYYIKLQSIVGPEWTNVYMYIGNTYRRMGKYEPAMSNYKRALQNKDLDADVNYNMFIMYSQRKMNDSAFYYLELSLKSRNNLQDTNDNKIKLKDVAEDDEINDLRATAQFRMIIEKYFKKEEIEKYPGLFLNK